MKYFFTSNYIQIMIILKHLSHTYTQTVSESTFEDVVENRKVLKTTNAPEYHFGYGSGPTGPRFWSTFHPTCGGKFQSPIDINLRLVQEVKIEKLRWKNYELIPDVMLATNNGHTISIKAILPNDLVPNIVGGPLLDEYTFQSLHFHWGTDDSSGSEHSLNNKKYVMEMHCIHKKRDLTMEAASSMHNGLVVVAYFFDETAEDNTAMNAILEEYNLLMVDVHTPLKLDNTFRLTDLIIPFTKDYITYQGSLTTPPCSEVVIWIISPYPSTISKHQLTKFRKISEATGMVNNFRPTQPVGNRTIYLVSVNTGNIANTLQNANKDEMNTANEMHITSNGGSKQQSDKCRRKNSKRNRSRCKCCRNRGL